VSIQAGQVLRVGPFIVWRNSAAEWINRFKVDNTSFFEMYRDRRGEPVGENASILSKADYSDASYDEFRDAVNCLSTAIWLRGGGPSASDAWVFERWHVDVPTPANEPFRRASKFSSNITSAKNERIYPTPYTYQIDLTPFRDQEAINHLSQELAKPREESMLTAFSHFHLARFDTPYFTSHGDAVEAMWSGFESLLEIDKFGPDPSRRTYGVFSRTIQVVRRLLARKVLRSRVGKDEKLVRALRSEFGKYKADWRPEFWSGIEAWSVQFYNERNHHSHGVRADQSFRTVDPYGLSAYEIAFHLARAVLRLQMLGDNLFFLYSIAAEANSLFLFAPVIERVARLRHHDRKAWFPGTGGDEEKLRAEDVDGFRRDLSDLVSLRLDSRQFQGAIHVAQARKKMGLVLSSWVEDLIRKPPANIDLTPVSQVSTSIQAWASEGKKDEEIDTDLGQSLHDWNATDVHAYGPGAPKEPRLLLRDKIPIWLWVDAYMKLTEVWLGYRLW
jgi:hypothetical protein